MDFLVAEWCRRNGLNDNTYFNWVTRLRKKGLLETPAVIPESIPHTPVQQEIVKVEISSNPAVLSTGPKPIASKTPEQTSTGAVMEIVFGGIKIKVTNQVNMQLLEHTLRMIGGGIRC